MVPSQFKLLTERRFGPLFATQFLGAFNDNLFRSALIVLIAFRVWDGVSAETLTNISVGLFVLPFLLFSPVAGQVTDALDKAHVIRNTKVLEVLIMLAAAVGFLMNSIEALIPLLFLMGMQSALFGPAKYSVLPQHLHERELVGGNGLVESGTFLAILSGMIFGGLLIALEHGQRWVAAGLVVVAVAGYLVSRAIPAAPPRGPGFDVNLNPIQQTGQLFRFLRQDRTVFLSVLGISWFWLLGALYLTHVPLFSKETLGANEQVVTLLLVLFSAGLGLGSLLCERLSGGKVELGLVPLGSLGITLFGIDLFASVPDVDPTNLRDLGQFFASPGMIRTLVDVTLIGVSGGLYVVPLYALIQNRAAPARCSRIIAAGNILNALFMLLGSLLAMAALAAGLSVDQLFLALALLNGAVAIYIYTVLPEFLMRFITWVLIHLLYRIDKSKLERIPEKGAAVLVCNHVSFVDPLVILACCPRPVRFVMYYRIFRIPLLRFVFETAQAIPIASSREDPELLATAYEEVSKALRAGSLVCIFPEGEITRTGEINPFKRGIERIVARDPVPVVPLALQGLWGSFFSRRYGAAMMGIPRKFLARIALVAGTAVPPGQVSAEGLEERVRELRGANQ